jgi:hypothetical protein
MAYEVFSSRGARANRPLVSSGYSSLRFNKASTELFGDATHLLLLWDKEARKAAVQPTNKITENVYVLHRPKNGTGSSVTARAFLKAAKFATQQHVIANWNETEGLLEWVIPKPVTEPSLSEDAGNPGQHKTE